MLTPIIAPATLITIPGLTLNIPQTIHAPKNIKL